jgi:gliding motility-associated lipoprotein GldD
MSYSCKIVYLIIFLGSIFAFPSCKKNYTPKPRGYFRISFPEKSYKKLNNSFPYNFEIPDYSYPLSVRGAKQGAYNIDVKIPDNRAEIHISYLAIDNNLAAYTEESRTLAYKHSVKADAIEEQIFINHKKNVFGTLYRIKGNAASPLQFYLTDSVNHFLRGALYIREIPNIDSLSPVINFLSLDVVQMIESTEWEKK